MCLVSAQPFVFSLSTLHPLPAKSDIFAEQSGTPVGTGVHAARDQYSGGPSWLVVAAVVHIQASDTILNSSQDGEASPSKPAGSSRRDAAHVGASL